jgi:hypothetical protein
MYKIGLKMDLRFFKSRSCACFFYFACPTFLFFASGYNGRKCPAVRERKNRENTIDYNADGKIDDLDRAIEYELYGADKDRLEDGES